MDADKIRSILTNLRNKLSRQRDAVESTETQITVWTDQLELFENVKPSPVVKK